MLNKRKGALSDAPTLSWSRVSFSSSPLAANSQVMVRGQMAVHRGQREREGRCSLAHVSLKPQDVHLRGSSVHTSGEEVVTCLTEFVS